MLGSLQTGFLQSERKKEGERKEPRDLSNTRKYSGWEIEREECEFVRKTACITKCKRMYLYCVFVGVGVSGSKGSSNTAVTLLGMPEARWHWSSRPLSISLPDRGNWIVHKNENWVMLFSRARADTLHTHTHIFIPKINAPAHDCARIKCAAWQRSLCIYIRFITIIMATTTSNYSEKSIVLFEHRCT